jgi:hypothetical protein
VVGDNTNHRELPSAGSLSFRQGLSYLEQISWERANDQNENLLFEINLAIKVTISE